MFKQNSLKWTAKKTNKSQTRKQNTIFNALLQNILLRELRLPLAGLIKYVL